MTVKQEIATIRKELKKRCKSLSVRSSRGTGFGSIWIYGSGEYGAFTGLEREVLAGLGLNPGHNAALIYRDSRSYWLKKLAS